MNGTTLYQVLYASYHTQGVQLAAQQSHALLAGITGTVHAMVGLWVLILGYGLFVGRVDFCGGLGRLVRAVCVVALMAPAFYDNFIIMAVTAVIAELLSG